MNLSSYSAIGSALLVKIAVTGEPVTAFSTYWRNLTVGGVTYLGLGSLSSITETQNNIRATGQQLSIGISGIPVANVSLVKNSQLRGSPVEIYRLIFDPVTGEPLAIDDNPTGRFFGIVDSFSIDFSGDMQEATRSATSNITIQVASTVSQMENKVSGRRTSSDDMKKYYPGDLSMDRVGSLARSNFNFGAPE
jgi:hypothetical protein